MTQDEIIKRYKLQTSAVMVNGQGRVMYEWDAVVFNTPIIGRRRYVGKAGALGSGLKFFNALESEYDYE
jgi:hypothetical protein